MITKGLMGVLAAALLAGSALAQETASPAVVMEMDPGLPLHTVYYPKGARERLGIVAFGNGGCLNDGSNYQELLREVASQGYLVIANGAISPPDIDSTTKPEQLIEAIDWAIAENARAGSKHVSTLDTAQVAVMGHSCGGRQALIVSADPRVKTSVILNSGVSGRDPATLPPILAKLHAATLYLSGGPSDTAYDAVESDFNLITAVPLVKVEIEVGHNGTYFDDRGGQLGGLIGSWLSWRLKGSQENAKFFVGKDCLICTAPGWFIAKKNID